MQESYSFSFFSFAVVTAEYQPKVLRFYGQNTNSAINRVAITCNSALKGNLDILFKERFAVDKFHE